MSKRKALGQGSKETGIRSDDEEKMSGNENNTPRRATAAQLASRKILAPKATLRGRTAPPSYSARGVVSHEKSRDALESITPLLEQAQERQQQNGLFGQQSQSFPQPTNTPNFGQQNSGNNSFGGFGSGGGAAFNFHVPSTGGFQFGSTPSQPNNPFSTNAPIMGGAQQQPSNPFNAGNIGSTLFRETSQLASAPFQGFQGSIFNIPASTPTAPAAPTPATPASVAPASVAPTPATPAPATPAPAAPTNQTGGNFGTPGASTSADANGTKGPEPEVSNSTLSTSPMSTSPMSTSSQSPKPEKQPEKEHFNIYKSFFKERTPIPRPLTAEEKAQIEERKKLVPKSLKQNSDAMQTSPDAAPKSNNPWDASAGEASQPPATSLSFDAPSTPTTSAPSNISALGSTAPQPSTSTNPLFGSRVTKPDEPTATPITTPNTPVPANPLFGNRVTKPDEPTATPTTTPNTPAPANPLFGNRVTKPADSSTIPASTEGQSAPTKPLFGSSVATSTDSPAPPASGLNLFGSAGPSTNNTTSDRPLFGATSQASPALSITGGPSNNTGAGLFGTAFKPAASGSSSSTPKPGFSTMFAPKPSAVDTPKQSTNVAFSGPFTPQPSSTDAPKDPAPASSTNLFTPKPKESESVTASQDTPNAPSSSSSATPSLGSSLLNQDVSPEPHVNNQSPGKVSNGHSHIGPGTGPIFTSQNSFLLPKPPQPNTPSTSSAVVPATSAFSTNAPRYEPEPPSYFDGGMKQMYTKGFNLRALNRSFRKRLANTDPDAMDIDNLLRFYISKRAEHGIPVSLEPIGYIAAAAGNKRKASDDTESEGGPSNAKRSRSQHDSTPTSTPSHPAGNHNQDAGNTPFKPSSQRPTGSFSTNAAGHPMQPMPTLGAKRASIGSSLQTPSTISSLGKRQDRGADDQDENGQAGKRKKDTTETPMGSQTSNMFKNMLDSNENSNASGSAIGIGSPHKSQPTPSWSNPTLSSGSTFGTQPASATPATSGPLFGVSHQSATAFFASNSLGPASTGASSTSTSAVDFGSATQPSQTPQSSNATNIFGAQPAVASTTPAGSGGSGTNSNAASGNTGSSNSLFGTAVSTANASSVFGKAFGSTSKPSSSPTPAFGGFVPTSTSGGSSSTDFKSQFASQSKVAEEEMKEERKKREFDSDEEDEEAWERKYEEDKRAKKAKFEQQTAKFVEGQGFSFSEGGTDDATSESDVQSAQAKPSSSFQPKPSPLSQNPTQPVPNTSQFSGVFNSGASTPLTSGGTSVFDQPRSAGLQPPSGRNIFGHLSDVESGADSKTGDADDEEETGSDFSNEEGERQDDVAAGTGVGDDTNYSLFYDSRSSLFPLDDTQDGEPSPFDQLENDTNEDAEGSSSSATPKATASGRDLFSRLHYDADGKPMKGPVENKENEDQETPKKKPLYPAFDFSNAGKNKEVANGSESSTSADKEESSKSSNPFAASTSRPLGQPTNGTSSFSASGSFGSQLSGDHTWNPNSPIKFGGAPSVNVTAPSPDKGKSRAVNGDSSHTPAKPFSSLFGKNSSTSSPRTLNNSASKPTLGFNFGSPKTQASRLAAGSGAGSSGISSRATSPGMTTSGGETDADVDVVEKHPQVDLMSGEGEKDDEQLLDVRAKVYWFGEPPADQDKPDKKGWQLRGTGSFRVLKNKSTGKCRIVHRMEPSGRVIVNANLSSQLDYEYLKPKQVKFLTATAEGTFDQWLLRIGDDAKAKEIASLLEELKSN